MEKSILIRIRSLLLKLLDNWPPLRNFVSALRSRFPSRHVSIRIQHDHLIQGIALSLSRNDGIFVDIGANRGLHLGFFFGCDPSKGHVAFEPLPKLAADLKSRFPSCEVHEVALSDSEGMAEFNVHPIATRSSIVDSGHSFEKLSVKTGRGDDFLADKKVKLIKIDVEGHEFEVLKGLTDTLTTDKPCVVFEHGGLGFQRSAEIFSFLEQHDYQVQALLTGEVLTSSRWMEVISRAEDYNFLATHS